MPKPRSQPRQRGSEEPWYTSSIVAFLCDDVPGQLGLQPADFERDVMTLRDRVASEGESFMTKTLPSLGKSIDYALQERAPLTVSGFKRRTRNSALPAFAQALLRRIFTEKGHVLDTPCIRSIRLVRQLCYWCKKVEKGYSDESLRKSVQDLIDTDRLLPQVDYSSNPELLGPARELAELIVGEINPIAHVAPKHGPGSVAWYKDEVQVGKRKMSISYIELEKVFRPIPWFFSLRDVSENPRRVTARFQTEYGLSRLAFVEKDSSGPRVIGLEPAEYMWCQQHLKRLLYDHLEKHPITKGRVNFTNQGVNRELTLNWRKVDTLDMSKASDRNSLSLVAYLLSRTRLWPFLLASRTPGVVLPDGSVFIYQKFAPMGSATCFPVEAITFYVLAVASLMRQGVSRLLAIKSVFVYGDDLVVPHGYFPGLKSDFESVGLKFSDEKCCTSGKFRESCGLDAYDGQCVTPVRLRRPHLRNGAIDLKSVVEHANALARNGYRAASRAFREGALSQFKALADMRIPYTNADPFPTLAWLDYEREPTAVVFYKDSQRYVTGYTFETYQLEGKRADEFRYLRESLSHGGPVGALIWAKDRWLRLLDARSSGRWVRHGRRHPLSYPDNYGEEDSNMQKHVNDSIASCTRLNWPLDVTFLMQVGRNFLRKYSLPFRCLPATPVRHQKMTLGGGPARLYKAKRAHA